ncbi:MAG TPA: methyltransferase domain-containing protein [Nonomuraea sp.]|nr:methyltransferase domain-containing protein [Nonomuraea sp.]
MTARYDGQAEWYDDFITPAAAASRSDVVELLGPGDGPCLDLGCGTGLYLDAIRATGRTVVGLDRSGDQLRIARRRDDAPLLQGDGTAPPFAAGVFHTVAAFWVSTDIGDFSREDGALIIHPTYRIKGWHQRGPWWRKGGVRERVGMSQVPLPDLINAFIDAGLAIERVYEPREHPIPTILAVRAYAR